MMLSTRRPAAEPVSSDSATLTRDTPRRLKRSSNSARSLTLRISRSSLATMTTSLRRPGMERLLALIEERAVA
jgi:hypothetical protein